MPFWTKKKSESKPPSRSNSLKSVVSNGSNLSPASSRTLKSIFKKQADKPIEEIAVISPTNSPPVSPAASPAKQTAKFPKTLEKRISTIVENVGEYSDDTDSVSGSDEDSDEHSSSDSQCNSFDEDDNDNDHFHEIRKLIIPAQISEQHSRFLKRTMGFSVPNSNQLKIIANEELKSTFSLLDLSNKIHQLSCHFNNYDSVIMEDQMSLMDNLKIKLNNILIDNEKNLLAGKTLFDRYGVVTNIIGRGAYGLIKIIKPESEQSVDIDHLQNHKFYAVKETLRRKDETIKLFIDRIISEFIIASTLNNKHIVKTVDLMIAIPQNLESEAKLCQVMECTSGGDLFTYMTTCINKNNNPIYFMSLDEIDCFIKQIAKGLYYMHQHGVAHCDLKLENILVNYKFDEDSGRSGHATTILKIADFGKANVLRTKWESKDQLLASNLGPIGSEPYMAPEEHANDANYSYSLIGKDNWALGIVIFLLFNIRKHYYSGSKKNTDSDGRLNMPYSEDSSGYAWYSTEYKSHSLVKKYKDRHFDAYTRTYMVADYSSKSKEWLVKRKGTFRPIQRLFVEEEEDDQDNRKVDVTPENEIDDLSELRRMIIYKLLDVNPQSRMTTLQLLKSDWMTGVESCS